MSPTARTLTDLDVIHVTVPGAPVGKQRPRRGKGGHFYTPKETQAAEQEIAWLMRQKWPTAPNAVSRFYISCTFYQTPQIRARGRFSGSRPVDIDNALKLVMDSVNGVVWNDDAQVDRIEAVRAIVAPEYQRTEIRIVRLPEKKEG